MNIYKPFYDCDVKKHNIHHISKNNLHTIQIMILLAYENT